MQPLFFDLETLRGMILLSFHTREEDLWVEFEISEYKNDLYNFMKFMEVNRDRFFCGFNTVGFDSQVMEYILRVGPSWYDYSNRQIIDLIYRKSQDTIEDSNFELQPTYREDEISFKQIDLYLIPHFDNQAKRCSLKWLEFMMNMPNIKEMPILHTQEHFTQGEIQMIKDYCRNDITTTEWWYDYLRGNVEHVMYKGQDKIQDRLDAITEFKFPFRAINWSDVRLGDELNKLGYCRITRKSPQSVYEMKAKRKSTAGFTFGNCIPEYVQFQTKKFQDFYEKVKKEKVNLGEGTKQEFVFYFSKDIQYTIARGGIHSMEKARVVIPSSNEILRDADIGSQYPNSIVKRELYPSHLGKEWLVNYKDMISRRIEYKAKSKDPKFKSLSEQYKLALNGGGFGKTNERTNWQYDPRVTFFCTIGNQFEILMLIEDLEINSIRVISANTDGILCLFPKELEDVYKAVCENWEQKVGNNEMGKLEYQDFTKIWQESVSHYIAVKPDGSLKIKGRFDIYGVLNKNNTDNIERITRLAIQEWVRLGTPVEETINNCQDIFMFCIGKKANSNYHWKTTDGTGEKNEIPYGRVIRFYISNTGVNLIKRKRIKSLSTGVDKTEYFRGHKVTICNDIRDANLENVDREYYIMNARKVIAEVESKRKKTDSSPVYNANQTTLF